jgi:DNA-binding SARP family transcriptional activator
MARDHYHQALNLYKGDFLENDLHEEWAMPKRRRLRNRWHLATHKLADLLAGNRQLEEALEIYEKLREADPLDETIYRSIMRINAQLARPQEIHRSYQRCERALLREIDCQPSAETTILYRNLLHMKN